jgi:hypothetical protein
MASVVVSYGCCYALGTMPRAVRWALTLVGVATILASLAVAGVMAFGFVLCASTGSSCGGSVIDVELLAIGGGGSVIGIALIVAAWWGRYPKTARRSPTSAGAGVA